MQKKGISGTARGLVNMDFGNINFDKIAEAASQLRAIASAAYFNPNMPSAGAAVKDKVKEITELLKGLPE
jgi:hypothetical protein